MGYVIDGVELVPTSEVCRRLAPDVTPETVYNWTAARGGRRAALRPVCGPDGRPIVVGGEHWYRWPEVVEVELAKRKEHRGRPRQLAA